jgi:hypothetical protein
VDDPHHIVVVAWFEGQSPSKTIESRLYEALLDLNATADERLKARDRGVTQSW